MYFSSVVFYHPSLQNRSEYLLYKLIHYSHDFTKNALFVRETLNMIRPVKKPMINTTLVRGI